MSLAESLVDRGGVLGAADHQAIPTSSVEQLGWWVVCVCLWAPAVRRPLSPVPDMSPIHPVVSLSVSHTHSMDPAGAQGELSIIMHTYVYTRHTHTHTLFSDMVLLAQPQYLPLLLTLCVAVGHGKSSMLPLIVLITSLGAASQHTRWPLPLLWNHALLT